MVYFKAYIIHCHGPMCFAVGESAANVKGPCKRNAVSMF